jgi:hypothetical protein
LTRPDRREFYAAYAFDVTPPTDDRPFFGHYFKWAQAGAVWAQLGKTWQPFGGAGYFVLVMLLAFAVAAAALLIVLPLVLQKGLPANLSGLEDLTGLKRRLQAVSTLRIQACPARVLPRATLYALLYFALLGLGFMLVEIPLVQRFILFVGKPVYALAAVLFGLLSFSGLGSLLAHRLPWRGALAALALLVLAYPLALPVLFQAALGWPLSARLSLSVLALAPLGLLMGVPFPRGLAWLERASPGLIAWAWGVNGAVSVVASVLAAWMALSVGFTVVLIAGALCYGAALLAVHRGIN